MQVHDVLALLEESSSRNAKLEILGRMSGDLEYQFKKVVHAAYDPFTNYYVTVAPGSYTPTGNTPLHNVLDEVVETLSSRLLTGHKAQAFLHDMLSSMSPNDAEVLSRVINRDLRVGCGVSTFNKVWPNLVSEFDLMACFVLDEKTAKQAWLSEDVVVQLKYDAARVAVIVGDDSVEYRTRNGLVYNIKSPELDAIFLDSPLRNVVYDGEMYQLNSAGLPESRTVSNGVATKFIRGSATDEHNAKIGISLWDVVSLDEFKLGVCKTPYLERFNTIVHNFGESLRVTPAESHIMPLAQAQAKAKEYMDAGQEGAIIKNPNGIWEAKRSKHCLKIKAIRQADLKVTGVVEGTGKYVGMLGAIIMESACGQVQVNVGTGLSDSDRKEMWETRQSLIDKIVTVEYNELVKPSNSDVYSLFLPRFIEIRLDKDVADSFDKIKSGI